MNNTLRHFGLIPDGTRRWAQENNYNLFDAYMLTMNKISAFLNTLFEQDVLVVSVYLLSTENLKRIPEHLDPVIDTEIFMFEKLLPTVVEQNDVQVIHAGKSDLLPVNYQKALSVLCSKNNKNTKKRLYLLAAYNPIDEIKIAINKSGEKTFDVSSLLVPELLDLVVRSSGESRLSNFLPLQAGYAELIIEPKHFNDLKREDVYQYLAEFNRRKRRFGQ